MATKKSLKTEPPQGAPPAAAAKKKPAASKGLFSITTKFTGLIFLLLLGLLLVVTFVIRNQLRQDLGREVAERGATVARNLAAPMADALLISDALTLAVLVKNAVEDTQMEKAQLGFVDQVVADLRSALAGKSVKNEGIVRALVVNQKGMVIADSLKNNGDEAPYDPPLIIDTGEVEPFPVFKDSKGRFYFDIKSDLAQGDKELGAIHLTMRRDVITDAVRVATARLVAIMLLSLVMGTTILFFIVRILLRPIGYLVGGVNAVAAGDFSKIIKVKKRDELGELIDAYNGMARNLSEKEAVQEALAKYTSKDLVHQMLTDSSKLELGGQRVHASIFFSVLRGLAALAGSMEPEKFVGIMNEYLEIETDIIMKNGGTIDKFIGDEVMALWGLKGEDVTEQAYLAVKAAVEIQDAIQAHNDKRQAKGEPSFECSIGVNTGEVVSGNMGSSVKMDNTVLGGNVNLAARLGLVAAKGGQTIISHATYALVADRFKIDKLAPMTLKGIKEPVPLYWPRKKA